MYEIDKELWQECKLCKKKIKDLAEIYGGSGKYYTQVFERHLKKDHNISRDEYFERYTKRPKCLCGICNKPCSIVCLPRSVFKWQEYACGRFKGLMEWSEKAKITRKGKGNPMYGIEAWNKGLTAETNEVVKAVRDGMVGRTTPEEVKRKQSKSAKKRKVHGHTGCKHSDAMKEKARARTLQMIKDGFFKQLKSKCHIKFGEILGELGIDFEEEYRNGHWSFDYYLIDFDVLIEVDGDYFHSNPKIYPSGPKSKTQKVNFTRDCAKNKYCIENNLKLLRFWECDVLENSEGIKCKLKELLELKV